MTNKPKIDQWVTDCWLGGIPSAEIAQNLRVNGATEGVIDAAVDLYEELDTWSQRSLERMAASCRDWKEF